MDTEVKPLLLLYKTKVFFLPPILRHPSCTTGRGTGAHLPQPAMSRGKNIVLPAAKQIF